MITPIIDSNPKSLFTLGIDDLISGLMLFGVPSWDGIPNAIETTDFHKLINGISFAIFNNIETELKQSVIKNITYTAEEVKNKTDY